MLPAKDRRIDPRMHRKRLTMDELNSCSGGCVSRKKTVASLLAKTFGVPSLDLSRFQLFRVSDVSFFLTVQSLTPTQGQTMIARPGQENSERDHIYKLFGSDVPVLGKTHSESEHEQEKKTGHQYRPQKEAEDQSRA
jgi:hypothetical protein